jgi:hypothetical protein
MCGRVIQAADHLRYAIVDGMNVRDTRVHNYPQRWKAAPRAAAEHHNKNHQSAAKIEPERLKRLRRLMDNDRVES